MKKIIAGVILALASITANAFCYSDGVRTGVVQKFSHKGWIFRNWEGELVLPGEKFRSDMNGLRGGNVWAFSVNDSAVAKEVEMAASTGETVALHYCQAFVTFGTTDTDYRIVKVTVQKK